MDRPNDAAVFRKHLCLFEYSRADLEGARRKWGSPACPNRMLMYYTAALVMNRPPSLPDFGAMIPMALEGVDTEDGEDETLKWSYRADPDVLASIVASLTGDRLKSCYASELAGGSSKPSLQWFAWSPATLWSPTIEPKVFDSAVKAIEDVANAVEKKLTDLSSFLELEEHFELVFRASMLPWRDHLSGSSDKMRHEDVLWHILRHADSIIKRLKASRDQLSKEFMLSLSRVCYEQDFMSSIDAPGVDLYPFKNGVQELSPPFGFGPATPNMRISRPVDIELPHTGEVGDGEFEEFLQFMDDEFFGHREVTLRELDKTAEAMIGTPGGCAEAGLNIWLGPFYVDQAIAASRCGKGRFAAFIRKQLGERLAMSVAHSVLEQGPIQGKTCEEMKPLANAHMGIFDEFNTNEAIGEAVKAKHMYINPNVVKNLVPSSTERVKMPFHGKYGTLTETSGKLVRVAVLANGVPATNVKDPSILNRLEVTPFYRFGFVTRDDLDKYLKDGMVAAECKDLCFVVDKARILGDVKYHSTAARYLVDRLISIRGGNAHGQTPRPQDKDRADWHSATKYHEEHKRRYIEAVSRATAPKVEYSGEQAYTAIEYVVGLRVRQCTGVPSEPCQLVGAELHAKLNSFQTASKGKDNCFCGKKSAADACHLEFKDYMEQLRVLAPMAWEYWAKKAGAVQAIQRALGIEERTIPQKKLGGKGRNNVIFGFRLIPMGMNSVDGTAFGKIESDDGSITSSLEPTMGADATMDAVEETNEAGEADEDEYIHPDNEE